MAVVAMLLVALALLPTGECMAAAVSRSAAFLASDIEDRRFEVVSATVSKQLMSLKLDDTILVIASDGLPGNASWTAIIIRAIVFAVFGSVALLIIMVTLGQRREAELLAGRGVESSIATITDKKHIKKDREHVKEHYEVNYWFSAVRSDGMRCRIEIKNRDQPFSLWRKLEEGSQKEVLYFPEDPEHCRLASAAESDAERSQGRRFLFQMAGSIFLMVISIVFGILLSTVLTGSFSVFCACLAIWLVCMIVCFVFYYKLIRPIVSPNRRGSSCEELGMQEPSQSLGDLSGTWLMESPNVKFEFKFQQVPGYREEVSIRGRRVYEWSEEVRAHFLSERKMTWETEDGMKWVVDFDSRKKFHGVGENCKTGESMQVTGMRREKPPSWMGMESIDSVGSVDEEAEDAVHSSPTMFDVLSKPE